MPTPDPYQGAERRQPDADVTRLDARVELLSQEVARLALSRERFEVTLFGATGINGINGAMKEIQKSLVALDAKLDAALDRGRDNTRLWLLAVAPALITCAVALYIGLHH